MPTRDQLFPSKYLKGHDLKGREAVVTIDYVESTKIRGDKVNIIHFEGKEKGLVMNVTIYNQIADALSEDDTDRWSGRQIQVFPTQVEYDGKMNSVVRVRPMITSDAPGRSHPEPPPPADEPFDPPF